MQDVFRWLSDIKNLTPSDVYPHNLWQKIEHETQFTSALPPVVSFPGTFKQWNREMKESNGFNLRNFLQANSESSRRARCESCWDNYVNMFVSMPELEGAKRTV